MKKFVKAIMLLMILTLLGGMLNAVTAEAMEPFTGTVKIKLETDKVLYYGDQATLRAKVSGTDDEWSFRWESSSDKEKWTSESGNSDKLSVNLTEDNAHRWYRVTLFINGNTVCVSGAYRIPSDRIGGKRSAEEEIKPEDEMAMETEVPAEATTQPVEEIKTEENEPPEVPEQTEELAQPTEEPEQIKEESVQPIEEVKTEDEEPEQTEEPVQPTEEPKQIKEESVQPIEEVKTEDEEPEQTEEPVQPTEEPKQIKEESVQPIEEVKTEDEEPEQTEEPLQPAEESKQIQEVSTQPMEEVKPVEEEQSEAPLKTEGTAQPVEEKPVVEETVLPAEKSEQTEEETVRDAEKLTSVEEETNHQTDVPEQQEEVIETVGMTVETEEPNAIVPEKQDLDQVAQELIAPSNEAKDGEKLEATVDVSAESNADTTNVTEENLTAEIIQTNDPVELNVENEIAEKQDSISTITNIENDQDAVSEETITEKENMISEDETLIQIRMEPDGMSHIIAEAPADTTFQVVDRYDDWLLVAFGDIYGYVHVSQVEGYEPLGADDPQNNKRVEIFTSQKSMVTEGEQIHLTSILYGLDGYRIEYQWQCDRGNGLEDIPGANDWDYYYTIDDQTITYRWRLWVNYTNE